MNINPSIISRRSPSNNKTVNLLNETFVKKKHNLKDQ